MCCWFVLAFAFAPRVALFLMWLLTDWMSQRIGAWWLALLGFFFMPWTTLTYTLVAPGGLGVFDLVFLAIAVIADIGAWGGGARARRDR